MKDLTNLFCSIDDFWKKFKKDWEAHLLGTGKRKRGPEPGLSISEMMTIVILFHQSNYRTFKHFYCFALTHLKKDFPKLISYNRFVHLRDRFYRFNINTSLPWEENKKKPRFKGFAKRGKTTSGWFYGFKLHLIINDVGEILSFLITPGNVADVSMVEQLAQEITGKLFGDKGYIFLNLGERLLKRGLRLFTTLRSNMKQRLISLKDKIFLRKRAIIETVNDQLKNISQIEHSRHRNVSNFLVNLLGGIGAYSHQEKKPSLKLRNKNDLLMITP